MPFSFNNLLYAFTLLLGTFTTALEDIPEKALLPTLLFVSFVVLMVTFFRFLQDAKALFPMEFTLAGIVMLFIEVHL